MVIMYYLRGDRSNTGAEVTKKYAIIVLTHKKTMSKTTLK